MRDNQMILLAGALALGLSMAGCTKKKDASSTASPATEPASQADVSSTSAPVAAVPATDPSQPTAEQQASFQERMQVQDLQLQVDAYEKIYKHKPASLEQMLREGFMHALPPAPPGKRFALDPATGRVSLVPR